MLTANKIGRGDQFLYKNVFGHSGHRTKSFERNHEIRCEPIFVKNVEFENSEKRKRRSDPRKLLCNNNRIDAPDVFKITRTERENTYSLCPLRTTYTYIQRHRYEHGSSLLFHSLNFIAFGDQFITGKWNKKREEKISRTLQPNPSDKNANKTRRKKMCAVNCGREIAAK